VRLAAGRAAECPIWIGIVERMATIYSQRAEAFREAHSGDPHHWFTAMGLAAAMAASPHPSGTLVREARRILNVWEKSGLVGKSRHHQPVRWFFRAAEPDDDELGGLL